jgi:hypothetical protein
MQSSRDSWKRKATLRAEQLREHRKLQKRQRLKIDALKQALSKLEHAAEDDKKNSS